MIQGPHTKANIYYSCDCPLSVFSFILDSVWILVSWFLNQHQTRITEGFQGKNIDKDRKWQGKGREMKSARRTSRSSAIRVLSGRNPLPHPTPTPTPPRPSPMTTPSQLHVYSPASGPETSQVPFWRQPMCNTVWETFIRVFKKTKSLKEANIT